MEIRPEDNKKVIGIKETTSKKTGNKFYTYYVTHPYSDYEVENSDKCIGFACESVGSSTDLGIKIGDTVEFNYGKAIGDYQPVKSVNIITPAPTK